VRVLIVGAAGRTGRELVTQALSRGHQVTAFVRQPARLPYTHPALHPFAGDVLDRSAVDAAVAGHDAVVCALGHPPKPWPTTVLSSGTRNIVRAMESHGVRRLVCETSLGLGESTGRMGLWYTLFVIPVILPFYYSDKVRQERIIRASGLDWVIVRPGALVNGPARGHYDHGPRVGHWLLTVRISRADVAAFMIDQLTDDRYVHAAPGVAW
jgi:putative NADH-flavin reductase